jgi:hypothetical protein
MAYGKDFIVAAKASNGKASHKMKTFFPSHLS